jgi:hypothetical protein
LTGRHEPQATGSFYLSLATAALRGALVIAAVVLGVFVLSRAFPSAGEATPVAPIETPTGEAPADGQEPGEGEMVSPPAEQETEEAPPPEEVTLQILNGTDVDGLAAETAEMLEAAGYQIDNNIDDANQTYEVTTLFFHPRSEAAAVALQAEFFPDSQLEEGARDLAFDVSVILGADYAAAREEAA